MSSAGCKTKLQIKVTSDGECAAAEAGHGGCRVAAAPDPEERQPPRTPQPASVGTVHEAPVRC